MVSLNQLPGIPIEKIRKKSCTLSFLGRPFPSAQPDFGALPCRRSIDLQNVIPFLAFQPFQFDKIAEKWIMSAIRNNLNCEKFSFPLTTANQASF